MLNLYGNKGSLQTKYYSLITFKKQHRKFKYLFLKEEIVLKTQYQNQLKSLPGAKVTKVFTVVN